MPKVLLVEDSAFERKLLRDMLRKTGRFTIVEAENGEVGLKLFEKENPDLVLLDLRMPGIPGMEVLRRIKEKKPEAKVIIVSIVRKKATIEEALKLGAESYLTKPVTEKRLLEEVEKVLG